MICHYPTPALAQDAGMTLAELEALVLDAVLVDWGRTFTGHEQIASWNANENIGVQSHIDVTGVERDGDRVITGVQVTGNGYNGGGSFAFETADGHITRMEIRG